MRNDQFQDFAYKQQVFLKHCSDLDNNKINVFSDSYTYITYNWTLSLFCPKKNVCIQFRVTFITVAIRLGFNYFSAKLTNSLGRQLTVTCHFFTYMFCNIVYEQVHIGTV